VRDVEEALRQEETAKLDPWRIARWAVAVLANASGNVKKPLKPEDLVKLPGDKEKKARGWGMIKQKP